MTTPRRRAPSRSQRARCPNGWFAIKPGRSPVELTRTLAIGGFSAFGPHYVHQVANAGTVAVVSVHVYTSALTVMNRYRLEPRGLRHLSVEHAGVNW